MNFTGSKQAGEACQESVTLDFRGGGMWIWSRR